MTAIIRQIQRSLAHGRPMNMKTGPLAAKVLKEIQTRTLEKTVSSQQPHRKEQPFAAIINEKD